MKKRIARILVYFTLACLALLIVTHPYIWQSIFGPTIKGEPLWAWQQEYRSQNGDNPANTTLWGKLLTFLRLDARPMRWIGEFPGDDPEMLPVLISLADDADEQTRAGIASDLGRMPAEGKAIPTLIRMLDDSSVEVRLSALRSLRKFGPKSAAALPKVRELFHDALPTVQMHAALTAIRIGEASPEALAMVRDGLKSPMFQVRQLAAHGLMDRVTNDEGIFDNLVDRSQNETDPSTRFYSIHALKWFGKKAVGPLAKLLDEAADSPRTDAIRTLGEMGPDAKDAIPALENLAGHPHVGTQISARDALKKIDPLRGEK